MPLANMLVIGLVVRIILWFSFHGTYLQIDDERDYNQLAVSLATNGTFAMQNGQPTSIRPPLYPLLVSFIYRTCGTENFQAVRLCQLVLSLATVVLIYLISHRLYDQHTARAAGWITSLYPSLLGYNNLLLTEVLFAFWLCLACFLLQLYFMRTQLRWLVGFGIVLGLGALTRSVLWLFPPFLIVYLILVTRDIQLRRRVPLVLVPAIAFCLTIAPWSYRNSVLQQTFTAVDVMGGRNFMMGNYAHTPMYRMWDAIGITDERAWYRVLAEDNPGYDTLTQGQRDKLAMRHGVQFVVGHPWLTAQRTIVRFFNFWQLDRSLIAGLSRGWWYPLSGRMLALVALVIFTSYASSLVCSVFGFLTLPPSDRRLHWFLLLLVAFVCAVHTAIFAHSRYHKSLMPFLFIYTGHFACNWRLALTRFRTRSFRLAAVVALILIASWLFEIIVVELPRHKNVEKTVSLTQLG